MIFVKYMGYSSYLHQKFAKLFYIFNTHNNACVLCEDIAKNMAKLNVTSSTCLNCFSGGASFFFVIHCCNCIAKCINLLKIDTIHCIIHLNNKLRLER